jgi:hypothetical protein
MKQIQMERVIDGKRYSTRTATLIADDVYWDGHNMERRGRNTWLYRTLRGNYFTVTGTLWQGEDDTLEPVSLEDATNLYETTLKEHYVPYEQAFPEVSVEDA